MLHLIIKRRVQDVKKKRKSLRMKNFHLTFFIFASYFFFAGFFFFYFFCLSLLRACVWMLFVAPVCAMPFRSKFFMLSAIFRQFSEQKSFVPFSCISRFFHSDSNKIWSKFPCYCLIPLLLLLLLFFVVAAVTVVSIVITRPKDQWRYIKNAHTFP